MDGTRLWLLAGLTIIVLAGAYVFLGPAHRPRKRRKDRVPGLQNLGNSCFLNAVLQALASCPSFINWLSFVTKGKSGAGDCNNFGLAAALLSTLKDLNNQNFEKREKVCSPAAVIAALRTRHWVISNEEQDAHELFHVLTTTLEEELVSTPAILSLLDIKKLEESCSAKSAPNTSQCSPKIITKSCIPHLLKYTPPTRGLLASQLKCKKCGYKYPVRYDNFDSISLTIPTPHWRQLQLQDCLQKFISCELVQDVNCENCTQKQSRETVNSEDKADFTAKTTFVKQLTFGKLPECLCIHIQRTVWLNNGMPMKCFDHIDFPEFLAMDDYVYQSNSKKNSALNYASVRLIGGSQLGNDSNSIQESRRSSTVPLTGVPSSQQTILTALKRSMSDGESSSFLLPQETSISLKEHVYMLKAVIVHLGDVFSGHFITYRRGPLHNHARHQWFCTSDTTVRDVSFEDVLQSSAYMLFYERIAKAKMLK